MKKKKSVLQKPQLRTFIEQRDGITLNGEKLVRGKDYFVSKTGRLTLSNETIKKMMAPNLSMDIYFTQKIRRKE